MSNAPSERIEAIHAMMVSGQQSVRLERHTLSLWGVTGGLLFLGAEPAINALVAAGNWQARWQQALIVLAVLGLPLAVIGWVDYRWTRRLRRARDETISFVQRQMLKVWWLVLLLGLLFTVGTMFYGGGMMQTSVWLTLVGLGLFVHGLFSEQPLRWYGLFMVATAVLLALAHLPFELARWVGASVFGLGLPLLGMISPRSFRSPVKKTLLVVLWIVLAFGPALLAQRTTRAALVHEARTVSLADYVPGPGRQIVTIPPETEIPLRLTLSGPLFEQQQATLSLRRSEPLRLLVREGELDGHFRIGDGPWKRYRYDTRLRIPRLEALFEGPQEIRVEAEVTFGLRDRDR